MPIIGTDRAVGQPNKPPPRIESAGPRDAWTLVGWLGLAFLLMGLADIALGFYPVAFGNAEWEFGIISGILNGFAIPTMGTYLLLGSAIARNKAALTRGVAVWMFAVSAILVVLGLLYRSVVPVAIRAVDRSDVVLLGMKKAIVKAAILVFAYWVLYLVGGIKGWKVSKRA